MTDASPWPLSLDDHQLLDVLGLNPARLPDPARWCAELRRSWADHERGFATSADVDRWRQVADRLGEEARGGVT